MVVQGCKSPSLKDAEDSRLMARIERNFECLRRDGRAAGTLSGWGDLLLAKFKNTEAEKNEMSPSQSEILRSWLNGSITGRIAMIDFLQGEQRVRQQVDPCSLTASFGLGSILDSEWLFVNVFSRPPQAVIYETLLLCAEDALEKKPENLTASQINLALRKLALAYLPRSGENASDAAQSESETAAVAAKENLAAGIPTKARDGSMAHSGGGVSKPAPGDHYLRIAVAMELLRLHVLEGEQTTKEKDDDKTKSLNETKFKSEEESLETLGEVCMLGLGLEDVEGIIAKELENIDKISQASGGGGDSDDGSLNGLEALEDQTAEKLNKFLEAYVDSVNKVKAKLQHQVRWLDERGAYLLLGVDTDASESSIKKRYHRLSLKAHPDKGGDAETFQKLTMAYETVMKKKKRAAARLIAMQKKGEAAAQQAQQAQKEAKLAAEAAKRARAENAKEKQRKAKEKKAKAKAKKATVSSSKNKKNKTTTQKPSSIHTPNRDKMETRAENTKRAQMAKYGQRRVNPFSSPASSHVMHSVSDDDDDDDSLPSPHSPDDWRVYPPSPPDEPLSSSASLRKETSSSSRKDLGGGGEEEEDWDLKLSDEDSVGSDNTEVISDVDIDNDSKKYESEQSTEDKMFEEYMKSRVRGEKVLFPGDEEDYHEEDSTSFEIGGGKGDGGRGGGPFDYEDTIESLLKQIDGKSNECFDDNDFLLDDNIEEADGTTSFEGDLFQSFENDEDDDDEEEDANDDGIWPGPSQNESDDDDKPVFSCEFGSEFGPQFGTTPDMENKNKKTSDFHHEVEIEDGEETEEDDEIDEDFDDEVDEDFDHVGVVSDDEESSPPQPLLTPAEHLAKLSGLEKVAKNAAKKAASLAHICIQWSKVVEEVRQLSRPRGVDHLSSLIKKGAFSSAVDVMEPTQEAASAVMDIVGSAIEVTKESPHTMGLASSMGFFKSADRVTTEGRSALSSAATASEVNAAAVKAMGKLSSLGDLARQDDEVHAALVDMLCLHFQRVADSTQQCAKQALVAVTAASHVCSLVDLIHSQAKFESETNDDDLSDDEEDTEDSQEAKKAQAQAQAEAQRKKKEEEGGGEEEEGGKKETDEDENEKENQSPEDKNKENGKKKKGDDDEETVDSLLGKLRDLHAQMRLRHAMNLKKANTEVNFPCLFYYTVLFCLFVFIALLFRSSVCSSC